MRLWPGAVGRGRVQGMWPGDVARGCGQGPWSGDVAKAAALLQSGLGFFLVVLLLKTIPPAPPELETAEGQQRRNAASDTTMFSLNGFCAWAVIKQLS